MVLQIGMIPQSFQMDKDTLDKMNVDTHWQFHHPYSNNVEDFPSEEFSVSSQLPQPLTEKEKALKLMKDKLALMSSNERMQELLLASNIASRTKDMEKYRIQRKRKNKAAAKSRTRNR